MAGITKNGLDLTALTDEVSRVADELERIRVVVEALVPMNDKRAMNKELDLLESQQAGRRDAARSRPENLDKT
jgi:hypothetical protein